MLSFKSFVIDGKRRASWRCHISELEARGRRSKIVTPTAQVIQPADCSTYTVVTRWLQIAASAGHFSLRLHH